MLMELMMRTIRIQMILMMEQHKILMEMESQTHMIQTTKKKDKVVVEQKVAAVLQMAKDKARLAASRRPPPEFRFFRPSAEERSAVLLRP